MSVQTVTQIIQLILAPVVMVTACGIIIGGMQNRNAAINDRLRALARERLDLLRIASATSAQDDPYLMERLDEIETQTPGLLRRHSLAHQAVLTVYSAIMLFVLCMFVIAVAAQTHAAWIATGALLVFLAGTLVLLLGIVRIVMEVRQELVAVHFEVERVMALPYPLSDHRQQRQEKE